MVMTSDKQIFRQLNKLREQTAVVLGIGNTLKADDGVGPSICQQLAQKDVCAEVINAGTVPENYIQRIIKKEPGNLVIIDAVDFGGKAGEIRIFGIEDLNRVAISTHTLSPRLFVEMIMQAIKIDVYFIGIQPAQIRLEQDMSEQVKQSAQKLVSILIEIFGSKG